MTKLGKVSYKKKRKRKISHEKKFSRRLKFIRKSKLNKISTNSKNNKEKSANINYTWTLTLFNFAFLFLKECSFSEKNDINFIKKFMSIITDLALDENEFIYWILLIEYYIVIISKKDLEYETLLHIAIIAKNRIIPNFSNNLNHKINKEKFDKINSILISKEIGIKEFVRKYNYYNERVKAQNERFYIDIKKIVNYIVDVKDSIENTNNYVEQNLTSVMGIDKHDDEIFMKEELNKFCVNKDDSSCSEGSFKNLLKNNIFLKE